MTRYTCQFTDKIEEAKIKDKWITEKIPLEPFALVSRDDDNRGEVEYNAFSHDENIQKHEQPHIRIQTDHPAKETIEC